MEGARLICYRLRGVTKLVRMAGTDNAEVAVGKLVNSEGAAVRSDMKAGLVQAHTIQCSLFSC